MLDLVATAFRSRKQRRLRRRLRELRELRELLQAICNLAELLLGWWTVFGQLSTLTSVSACGSIYRVKESG